MASKKGKAARTDDNLDDLFSGIGNEAKPKKAANTKTAKPASAAAKAIGKDDFLADLESELAPQPASRPHTPRLKEAGARRSTATPPAGDEKSSAVRKSTDSARSLKASFTPSATSSDLQESEKRGTVEQTQQAGAGWWGGILSTATGVMKQAEIAYTQLQQNEEAKKWTDQMKGLGSSIDVNALRSYGDELRNRAMPTISNILNTIAPPIGSHERLLIHTTHDFVGYPSLEPLIYEVFSNVMLQVEGGDLKVVQRGHETGSQRSRDNSAGWDDGPWWKQIDQPRELGIVKGMVEATKLCRANAESYAQEYFAPHGGVESVRARELQGLSETNPLRTSHLFLSVQAIVTEDDSKLFARTTAAEKDKKASTEDEDTPEDQFRFAIFILDPVHEIEYATVSQPIPARWVHWLEAPTPLTPLSGDDGQGSFNDSIHEDIRKIVESGGLDPREWVAGWVKDSLVLSAGVVAQWYVAKRMGVGAGPLERTKKPEPVPPKKVEEEEEDEDDDDDEEDDDEEDDDE